MTHKGMKNEKGLTVKMYVIVDNSWRNKAYLKQRLDGITMQIQAIQAAYQHEVHHHIIKQYELLEEKQDTIILK